MANLWSIGDSFTDVAIDHRSYPRLLASDLGLRLAEDNPAVGASSLDHMFMRQWPRVLDGLGSGDVLIVGLTNPDRTFFFPEDHMLSMPDCVEESWLSNRPYMPYRWTDGERDALRLYYTHLHSDARNLSWLRSWLHHLDGECSRRGATAIVMDGFTSTQQIPHPSGGSIIRARGSLSGISMAEVANRHTQRYLSSMVDPRINHMMLRNHRVMASKLRDSLASRDLDLTNGFHAGCFDVRMVLDDGWSSENIGQGHISREWVLERIRRHEEDMG